MTQPQSITTQQFWDKMCDARFRRIDLYTGVIEDIVYQTDAPPEAVPGFIEDRLDLVFANLEPIYLWPAFFAATFALAAVVLFFMWIN